MEAGCRRARLDGGRKPPFRSESDNGAQCGAGGGEDVVGRELADAVTFIGITGRAGAGELSGGETRAGERCLEDGVTLAEGAPDRGVLGTKECDDGCADGGGDVHGAAVVAEEEIELREERGELADGECAVEGHEVGLGVYADFLDECLFRRAGDDEDLGVKFVLETVADGGEAGGGPDAVGAATAGMEQNSPGSGGCGLGSGGEGLGSGAEERSNRGEVGGEWDEADFASDDGDAERPEEFEVGVSDVMRVVERVGDVRGVGVERTVAEGNQFAVEADALEGTGEAGEERGLVRVVEVEDVCEAGAAKGSEERGPCEGRAGKGAGRRDVGVECEDGGVGGFGENSELCVGPVKAQVAEDAAEQNDIAEVAAADDEDARGVGGRVGGHRR